MEAYDLLRLVNVILGAATLGLALRSAIRSWKHLSPSERLILMVLAGYAFTVAAGSATAIHIDAPSNWAQLPLGVVQVWAVVALTVSRPRSQRLTDR